MMKAERDPLSMLICCNNEPILEELLVDIKLEMFT